MIMVHHGWWVEEGRFVDMLTLGANDALLCHTRAHSETYLPARVGDLATSLADWRTARVSTQSGKTDGRRGGDCRWTGAQFGKGDALKVGEKAHR